MKNRAAKLARDLDIELGDSFLRGSSTRRSIGIILHFDKGTICYIKEHFDEGKIYGHVEISFSQPFGSVLLYKIPDTWIEEI
jgi:hypothetical protein